MSPTIFETRRTYHFSFFDYHLSFPIRFPFSHKPKTNIVTDEPPSPEVKANDVDVKHVELPSFQPEALHIKPTRQDIANFPPNQRFKLLKEAIVEAVKKVGMSNPPETQTNQPSMPTHATEGGAGQALFCGTYGQVREALKEAGLEVVPCEQFGFKDGEFESMHIPHIRLTNFCLFEQLSVWEHCSLLTQIVRVELSNSLSGDDGYVRKISLPIITRI